MSDYIGAGELTKKRNLPEWMYAHPDDRNKLIKHLEAVVKILATDAAETSAREQKLIQRIKRLERRRV